MTGSIDNCTLMPIAQTRDQFPNRPIEDIAANVGWPSGGLSCCCGDLIDCSKVGKPIMHISPSIATAGICAVCILDIMLLFLQVHDKGCSFKFSFEFSILCQCHGGVCKTLQSIVHTTTTLTRGHHSTSEPLCGSLHHCTCNQMQHRWCLVPLPSALRRNAPLSTFCTAPCDCLPVADYR